MAHHPKLLQLRRIKHGSITLLMAYIRYPLHIWPKGSHLNLYAHIACHVSARMFYPPTQAKSLGKQTHPAHTRHLLQSPLSITSTQYPLHSPICNPVPPSPTILPQNPTQPNIKALNTQHKTLKPLDTPIKSPPLTCISQNPTCSASLLQTATPQPWLEW